MNWFIRLINFLFMPDPIVPILPPSMEPPVTPPPPTPVTPVVPASKYAWDTPQAAKQSTRAICDEEGLSLMWKDTLTACVIQESQFYNILPGGQPTKHVNYVIRNGVRTISSTDWGIVQINDYWHIGPGKDFPSVDYVLSNPEKTVRYMARMFKAGHANLWSSYVTGAYKKWL